MNNKILGYGSIVLAVLLLFVFTLVPHTSNTSTGRSPSLIPNIASPGLSYNGVNLTDHTVFNETSNTCTASRLGMNLLISPCVAQSPTGRNIQQFVDFSWNGAQPQNVSWIFVYDGGALETGRLEVAQNVTESYNDSVIQNQAVNNVVVTNITGFVNLGSPNSLCQLGNTNNTQMYNVTRNVNGTSFSQIYCFTSANQINAQTYSLSGNRDVSVMVQRQRTVERFVDRTNQVQFLGLGLLNDSRAYYRVQSVNFNPGQTIKTHWIYTPENVSRAGKWHILGYDATEGLTQSIALNHYIYMDPWWNNAWTYKKNITITGSFPSNYSVFLNVPNSGTMQAGYQDVVFVDASETVQLPAWNQSQNTSNLYVWTKLPVADTQTIWMYYNNPAASSTFDINTTFLYGTEFPGSTLESGWDCTGSTCSQGNGYLNITQAGDYYNVPFGTSYTDAQAFMRYKDTSNGGVSAIGLRRSSAVGGQGGSNYVGHRGFNAPLDTEEWSGPGSAASLVTAQGTAYVAGTWEVMLFKTNGTVINQTVYTNEALTGKINSTSVSDASYASGYPSIFNRGGSNTLTADWFFIGKVTQTEPSYSFGPELQQSGVATTLLYPSTGYVSNNTNVSFSINSSASGSSTLDNVTIYVWNSSDDLNWSLTRSISGSVNISNFSQLFGDGDYKWGALTVGDSGAVIGLSANNTFTIDTALPQLSFIIPTNGTEFATLTVPYNVSYNYSITENNAQACWFNNETANISLAACGNNFSVAFGNGYHTVRLYANDTAGNENSAQTTVLINFINPNVSFANPVVEGQQFNATFNLSAGLINTLNASLNYNGTLIPMSVVSQNSTFAQLRINASAPTNISSNQLVPLYVNYTLNGNNYSTDQQNQTVLFLTPIVIATACDDKAMSFNAKDEQNFTALSVDINYYFQYGLASNNTYKILNGSLSGASAFYLCINSTVSNAYSLGYGEIQYQATGGAYVQRRYYTFSGKIISNQTEAVTLYDLVTSSATSFLVEAKDQTLSPYVQKFLGLLRWYPQLATYNLVEMAQTDENGRSIMRVRTEDVDYRVALWEPNGTLIKLNDPTRFACLTQPCTYSFTVFPSDQDYTSVTGIQQSLTFNETSSRFVYVWNDPSQRTQTMNLTVYRETGVNVGQICESIGTGAVGAISCDVSGYNGQLRAVVFRSASPGLPIAQLLQTIGQSISSVASRMGLFISAILAVGGFFIGIFNPIIGIIMLIASLIPSVYLGATTMAVLIGFAVMGVVVIHFMRRVLGG